MPSGESERELADVVASLEYAAQALKQKNYSAALPVYRRALDVLERNFGAGDPDTIACLQSLGDIYFQLGRYQEAMPHYKRLLVIGEKVLGRKHPSVIDMILRLASTYQQLGLNDDAETLFRRANTMSSSSMATLSRPLPEPRALPEYSSASTDETARMADDKPKASKRSSTRFSEEAAPPPPPKKKSGKSGKDSKKGSKDSKNGSTNSKKDGKEALRDGAESDAVQSLLILLQRSSGVFISLLVVGVLIFCGYMMLNVLNTSSAKPTQLNHLKGTSYKTSDGQIDLVINNNADPTYKIGSNVYAASLTAMGPDLMDFKDSILSSLFNKEIWFEETPYGLLREDGTVLYSKNGPEIRIVRQLDMVGRIATSWFQQRREYPIQNGDVQLGELAQNAVSARTETPSVDRLESQTDGVQEFVDVPSVNLSLDKILLSAETGKWLKEAAPYPGGIHCLNAIRRLPQGDKREFFAHGFDRNGKFIAGSTPGTVYLIAFNNGKQNFAPAIDPPKPGRAIKLCIVRLPNNTPIWFLHYFTPIALLSLAALFFAAGKSNQAEGERNTGTSAATRVGFVMFFVACLWIASYFIP